MGRKKFCVFHIDNLYTKIYNAIYFLKEPFMVHILCTNSAFNLSPKNYFR